MLEKINGYKKLVFSLLTFVVIGLNSYFGKDLGIDATALTDVIFAFVGTIYVAAQAVHDVAKEKNKVVVPVVIPEVTPVSTPEVVPVNTPVQ